MTDNGQDTGPRGGELALAFGGGGARSAYQVGVLRSIARRLPHLRFPILTGISAGAINTAHLANHTGDLREAVEDLVGMWSALDVDDVFVTRGLHLMWRALRIGLRLSIGLPRAADKVRGMVDTGPLRETLMHSLGTSDGTLPGIRANLDSGRLSAVALVATRYATNQTVSFFMGRDIGGWERPKRRGVRAELGVDHVMASAALPLFFPPIRVGDDWYGDGGIRLTAPLAPAVHLGARRVLAVSTRYEPTGEEADVPRFAGPPRPAQVLSTLWSAVFLDQLEQDAVQLERVNRLVRRTPLEERGELREIGLRVVRPSRDLGLLAGDFEPDLPRAFRLLTRRWGTRQAKTQDLLSTVMFQHDYVRLLMEIGEEDGDARADELEDFLQG